MSKYNELWMFIKCNYKDDFNLSFQEIKEILGYDIDHSFLTYKKELLDYGFSVKKISMKDKIIYFEKIK